MVVLKICLLFALFMLITDGVRWLGNKLLKKLWPARFPIEEHQTAFDTVLYIVWGIACCAVWTLAIQMFG